MKLLFFVMLFAGSLFSASAPVPAHPNPFLGYLTFAPAPAPIGIWNPFQIKK